MAFPSVGTTATSTGSFATSYNPTLPTGIQTGNLLIAVTRVSRTDGYFATLNGWTEIVSETSHRVAVKVAGATNTLSLVNTAEEEMLHVTIVGRIIDWEGTLAGVEDASASGGCPSLTPSWGSADTLWLALSSGFQTGGGFSAAPSGYSGFVTKSDTMGDEYHVAWAYRQLAASSEDPGSFSYVSGTEDFSTTVAVRPIAASAAIWVSPADTADAAPGDALVWTSVAATKRAHFKLQIASDSGFSSGLSTYYSYANSGFEYWDGSAWQTLGNAGMPDNKTGNDVRYTATSGLSGTKYRRVAQTAE